MAYYKGWKTSYSQDKYKRITGTHYTTERPDSSGYKRTDHYNRYGKKTGTTWSWGKYSKHYPR